MKLLYQFINILEIIKLDKILSKFDFGRYVIKVIKLVTGCCEQLLSPNVYANIQSRLGAPLKVP